MDPDTKMGVPQGNPPPYTANQPPPGQPNHIGPAPTVVTVVSPTVYHTNRMGTTVVPLVMAQPMGTRPATLNCRSCHAQIVTRVEATSTMRTHIFALMLCLIGCFPCAIIPYCMDSCKNADHYCPNCNSYIGSYMN